VRLLNEVARTGELPAGQPNVCEKVVLSRTPKGAVIKQLKAKGMKL
jgi:hypothetical protein